MFSLPIHSGKQIGIPRSAGSQSQGRPQYDYGRKSPEQNLWLLISQEKYPAADYEDSSLEARESERQDLHSERTGTKEQLPDEDLFEEMLDSLGPIKMQKRLGNEYYDDYAANDERDESELPEENPGLSRNRNKAFEAINQELHDFQHIKPHANVEPSTRWHHDPSSSSQKKDGSVVLGQADKSHPRECYSQLTPSIVVHVVACMKLMTSIVIHVVACMKLMISIGIHVVACTCLIQSSLMLWSAIS